MKKLLIIGLLFGHIALQAEDNKKITFDFWNKTEQPLYFEISKSPSPTGKNLVLLNAYGKDDTNLLNRVYRAAQYGTTQLLSLNVQGDFVQSDVNIGMPTYILLTRKAKLQPGDTATLLTIRSDKDIYLRIKPDKNGEQLFPDDSEKYLVGPQTGPMLGWLGRTERWLSKANIVQPGDISIDTGYVVGTAAEQPSLSAEEMSPQERELVTTALEDDQAISDASQKLDDTIDKFDDAGQYRGTQELTQQEIDAYKDALQTLRDAGYDQEWISYYEQWLPTIQENVGALGTSKTTQLVDVLSGITEDKVLSEDETQQLTDVLTGLGVTNIKTPQTTQ